MMDTAALDTICRICGENNGENLNLSLDNNKSYLDKIRKLLPVKIDTNDTLPKNMCTICWVVIEQFDILYDKCKQVENYLKQMCGYSNEEDIIMINNNVSDKNMDIDNCTSVFKSSQISNSSSMSVDNLETDRIQILSHTNSSNNSVGKRMKNAIENVITENDDLGSTSESSSSIKAVKQNKKKKYKKNNPFVSTRRKRILKKLSPKKLEEVGSKSLKFPINNTSMDKNKNDKKEIEKRNDKEETEQWIKTVLPTSDYVVYTCTICSTILISESAKRNHICQRLDDQASDIDTEDSSDNEETTESRNCLECKFCGKQFQYARACSSHENKCCQSDSVSSSSSSSSSSSNKEDEDNTDIDNDEEMRTIWRSKRKRRQFTDLRFLLESSDEGN